MNSRGEMYGFERLLTSIENAGGLSAAMCLEKLMGDVSDFVGGAEQHDDLTLVVMKVE